MEPKTLTIRIAATPDELAAINRHTSPRQRAVVLAELAQRVHRAEVKAVIADDGARAIVGYINLTRRVATGEHECAECGNAIGNLGLFLTVYADGDTGPVVCNDCATD